MSSSDDGPPGLTEIPVSGSRSGPPPLGAPLPLGGYAAQTRAVEEDSDSDDDGPPGLREIPMGGGAPQPRRPANDADDSDSDSDDDVPPELQDAQGAVDEKSSRAEKKARKALSKVGMVDAGSARVTLVKRDVMYVIEKADIFKSQGMEDSKTTYVCFGAAKVTNLQDGPRQQQGGGQPGYQPGGPQLGGRGPPPGGNVPPQAQPAVDSGVPEDESGLDKKDVELVLTQTGVSRNEAVIALRESAGDVVTAIMNLTMA